MDDFLFRARPWAITLVLHNWPLIVYSALVPLAALRAYLRPTRRALLLLYGLAILALAYEYQKHGVGVARETASYLFSAEANPELRRASQLVLTGVLPLATHLVGLALLVLSAVPRRHPGPAERSAPLAAADVAER